MLGARDIFIGVNALDYSGYPDCRPEYIDAYERDGRISRRGPGSRARDSRIHTPLIELTKARDHRAGAVDSGVDYAITCTLLRPVARRRRLRALRRVPAPAQGVRRGGSAPIPRATQGTRDSMTYAVKEIFYTLQGEGANAGRPAVFCRFAGCNLWTAARRIGPTPICRFCDTEFVGTDGPGGGRFADGRGAGGRGGGRLAAGRPRARPLRGLHRRRAAAAARRRR